MAVHTRSTPDHPEKTSMVLSYKPRRKCLLKGNTLSVYSSTSTSCPRAEGEEWDIPRGSSVGPSPPEDPLSPIGDSPCLATQFTLKDTMVTLAISILSDRHRLAQLWAQQPSTGSAAFW